MSKDNLLILLQFKSVEKGYSHLLQWKAEMGCVLLCVFRLVLGNVKVGIWLLPRLAGILRSPLLAWSHPGSRRKFLRITKSDAEMTHFAGQKAD